MVRPLTLIGIDAYLVLFSTYWAAGTAVRAYQAPELPVRHLGPMGPLHRRDVYDDVR
jgi:hypothetical protein